MCEDASKMNLASDSEAEDGTVLLFSVSEPLRSVVTGVVYNQPDGVEEDPEAIRAEMMFYNTPKMQQWSPYVYASLLNVQDSCEYDFQTLCDPDDDMQGTMAELNDYFFEQSASRESDFSQLLSSVFSSFGGPTSTVSLKAANDDDDVANFADDDDVDDVADNDDNEHAADTMYIAVLGRKLAEASAATDGKKLVDSLRSIYRSDSRSSPLRDAPIKLQEKLYPGSTATGKKSLKDVVMSNKPKPKQLLTVAAPNAKKLQDDATSQSQKKRQLFTPTVPEHTVFGPSSIMSHVRAGQAAQQKSLLMDISLDASTAPKPLDNERHNFLPPPSAPLRPSFTGGNIPGRTVFPGGGDALRAKFEPTVPHHEIVPPAELMRGEKDREKRVLSLLGRKPHSLMMQQSKDYNTNGGNGFESMAAHQIPRGEYEGPPDKGDGPPERHKENKPSFWGPEPGSDSTEDSGSDSGSDSDSEMDFRRGDREEHHRPPPPPPGAYIPDDSFAGALSYGAAGDMCMYDNYPKLSSSCKDSIQGLQQLREEYWQEYQEQEEESHHHGGDGGIWFLLLLVLLVLGVVRRRRRNRKNAETAAFLGAIQSDPLLKARVEESTGMTIPVAPVQEGCCGCVATDASQPACRTKSFCCKAAKFILMFTVVVVSSFLISVSSLELTACVLNAVDGGPEGENGADPNAPPVSPLLALFVLVCICSIEVLLFFACVRVVKTLVARYKYHNSNTNNNSNGGNNGGNNGDEYAYLPSAPPSSHNNNQTNNNNLNASARNGVFSSSSARLQQFRTYAMSFRRADNGHGNNQMYAPLNDRSVHYEGSNPMAHSQPVTVVQQPGDMAMVQIAAPYPQHQQQQQQQVTMHSHSYARPVSHVSFV